MRYLDLRIVVLIVFSVFVSAEMAFGSKSALLTQEMINKAGDCFVIKKNYSANNSVLYLPENFTFVFEGGRIDKAELVGNHSNICVNGSFPIFGKNIIITGSWEVREVFDGWFEFEHDKAFVSNQLIQNMLAFSNDNSICHLFFIEDRVYYFELPYKGDVKIGEGLSSYIDRNGNRRKRYSELYDDKLSFLRIFTIPSNTKITLNSTLQMLPTNQGVYFVFWEYGKENVTIEGTGVIAGDNKEHFYTLPFFGEKYYGEWGILFQCFKCKNFVFRGITLKDSFGDCILYQGSYVQNEDGHRYADGLLVENVNIVGARRNGIALGARNAVIRNCHFEGCGTEAAKGTRPRAAIDFEPDGVRDYPEIGNENVLMENCTFVDNWRDISTHFNNWKDYGQIATTIKDCIFTDTVKLGHSFWMRFENCYFPFLYNSDDERSVLLHAQFMEFVDCEFGQWDADIPKSKTKNNRFINCKFNTAKNNKKKRIVVGGK